MGKVKADISMSLDGFITGPNPNKEQGLGENGDRLHQWVYELASWREPHGLEGGESNQDSEILEEAFASTGAVIIGREMFEHADAWGDEPPFHMPVYVVTHEPKDPLEKKGVKTFYFVEGGIEKALEQACDAAEDKDVSIGGGAKVIQQFIKLRLLDEIQIHIIPVIFGAGTRLFENMGTDLIEFDIDRVVDSPEVTHLKLRLKEKA